MADEFQSDFLYLFRREKSQAERNLSTQSRGVLRACRLPEKAGFTARKRRLSGWRLGRTTEAQVILLINKLYLGPLVVATKIRTVKRTKKCRMHSAAPLFARNPTSSGQTSRVSIKPKPLSKRRLFCPRNSPSFSPASASLGEVSCSMALLARASPTSQRLVRLRPMVPSSVSAPLTW